MSYIGYRGEEMKYTVQIVGVGGQGVLLASNVLGNAAMSAGMKVMMSEVHGMAQRGGSVLSTVRIGDEVFSPLEAEGGADMIMGFEPAETVRSLHLGNKDTRILMNLDPVLPSMVAAGFEEYPDIQSLVDAVRSVNAHVYTIGATSIAIEAGKAVAANAVMIGAMAAVDGFPLSKQQLYDSLVSQVPAKFRDLNVDAFERGFNAVRHRCRTNRLSYPPRWKRFLLPSERRGSFQRVKPLTVLIFSILLLPIPVEQPAIAGIRSLSQSISHHGPDDSESW